MTLAAWTDQKVLNQLVSGSWKTGTITYSFPTTSLGLVTRSGEAGGFVAFTESQKPIAQLALQLWDDAIGANMVAVAPGSSPTASNIEFAFSSTNVWFAHTYNPSEGSIWFDPSYNSGGNNLVAPVIGRNGFLTYVHEIGHALGLEHMGEYNGSSGGGPSSFQDSTLYSIMSYYGPSQGSGPTAGEGLVAWADWVGADGRRYSPQTPMINDIMAVQSIYGVETTTRTGNTVYGFNSNVTGAIAQILDFSINKNPILTIVDSAGIDTVDLSGYAMSSIIDLAPGGASSANAMTLNIWIARSTIIENAIGGAGSDTLFGNDVANVLNGNGGHDQLWGLGGDDVLIGGAGDDWIDGGNGTDTAILDATWGALSIWFDSSTMSFTIASGGGTDIISGVELFMDSANEVRSAFSMMGATPTYGTASANTLSGGNGSDYLYGLAGNDTLYGGSGNDYLDGGAGRDRMFGGAGNDVYVVDDMKDRATEIANEGIDTIRTTLANMTLGNNLENLTYAGSSSFRGTGNAIDNILRGGNGNDVLNGGLGSDTLWGGIGNDTFDFRSALGPNNVDIIKDFNATEDTIRLENAVFRALTKTGPLSPDSFVTGATAVDANDRILFDHNTGALYYDRDGSGSAAAIKFAVLDLAGLTGTVTASDFVIV